MKYYRLINSAFLLCLIISGCCCAQCDDIEKHPMHPGVAQATHGIFNNDYWLLANQHGDTMEISCNEPPEKGLGDADFKEGLGCDCIGHAMFRRRGCFMSVNFPNPSPAEEKSDWPIDISIHYSEKLHDEGGGFIRIPNRMNWNDEKQILVNGSQCQNMYEGFRTLDGEPLGKVFASFFRDDCKMAFFIDPEIGYVGFAMDFKGVNREYRLEDTLRLVEYH